jgi:hypothetical protein
MIEAVAARVEGVVLDGDLSALFERTVADDVGEIEVAFNGVAEGDGVAIALA